MTPTQSSGRAGVRELVCDALEAGSKPRLTEIAPEVLFWITATIRGAADAYEELGQPALRAAGQSA